MQEPISEVSEEGFPVTLPSGSPFTVIHTSEVAYVEDRVRLYSEEFKWSNISDVQDVDRIIILELLSYRYGLFLAQEKDYFGEPVAEQALRKAVQDYSSEIRAVKKQLGMDKSSRDRQRGEDSVTTYLEQLRVRAREFGINRNEMMDRGLELGQQLIALWTLHDRCDEQERLEMKCTAQDVVDWIGDVYVPSFEEVDKKFRETTQKYWIASQ